MPSSALTRLALGAASALCLVAAAPAEAQQEELRNDGFETGQPVNFQAGFVEGEIAAVRLVPTLSCPCRVENVSLLFGGAGDTQPVLLRIWEDTGNVDPGTPLYVDSFQLTGSNVALQVIDPSPTEVVVDGPFRVGIEFAHSGLPSVASDTDGTIDTAANFILAYLSPLGFFWFQSADLGVSGDWVIRATISQVSSEPGVPALSVPGLLASPRSPSPWGQWSYSGDAPNPDLIDRTPSCAQPPP